MSRRRGPGAAGPVHRTGSHPFAAVVKPTDRCNLACRYCYVTHRAPQRRMTAEVLEAVVAAVPRIAAQKRALHFIWHGGEPLLLGLDFFEQVLAFQRAHCRGWTIDNCVQTNGTLLDREAARFFARNGFAVSLSLDGPRALHDGFRTFPDGRGSHRRVMKAIGHLRAEDQLVGAVAVLSPETARDPAALYAFMKRSGVQYRVNPVVVPEGAAGIEQLTPRQYGEAMCALFDLWLEDDDPPHIDPIHLIVGNMLSGEVWGCDFHGGCCRDVVAINADGSVYPCGQLAGRSELLLGNVLVTPAAELLGGAVAARVLDRRRRLRDACGACEFTSICGGGCMATAWIRHGDLNTRDYFCEGRQLLFTHVRSRLTTELRRAYQGGERHGCSQEEEGKGNACAVVHARGAARARA